MKHDILKIKSSPNVFVFAGKTNILYEIPAKDHKQLLHKKHHKIRQKVYKMSRNCYKCGGKACCKNMKLDDPIESLVQASAFITLKDHKKNFRTSHKCCLIDPSESELGKVSKVILENVNTKLEKFLNVNQWRNADSVINWFNTIENKSQYFFI